MRSSSVLWRNIFQRYQLFVLRLFVHCATLFSSSVFNILINVSHFIGMFTNKHFRYAVFGMALSAAVIISVTLHAQNIPKIACHKPTDMPPFSATSLIVFRRFFITTFFTASRCSAIVDYLLWRVCITLKAAVNILSLILFFIKNLTQIVWCCFRERKIAKQAKTRLTLTSVKDKINTQNGWQCQHMLPTRVPTLKNKKINSKIECT